MPRTITVRVARELNVTRELLGFKTELNKYTYALHEPYLVLD